MDIQERLGYLSYLQRKLENETHLSFHGDDFNSRLRIQKTVYLLKVLRIKPFLDYDFSYYIRGPYSTALAKDYYALQDTDMAAQDFYLPQKAERTVIEAANKGNQFLEAVATLHFAWSTNAGIGREETIEIVKKMKPALATKLSEAWQFLVERSMVH